MITQEELDRDYIDSSEAAKKLRITDARVRRLCLDQRFSGALKAGKSWIIPKTSVENFTRSKRGRKTKELSDREIWNSAIKQIERENKQ